MWSGMGQPPVNLSSGTTQVQFRYQGPVDILVGMLSCDFRALYWLGPDCQWGTDFRLGAHRASSWSCTGGEPPLSEGYVIWMVSPKPLEILDWSNDPYTLWIYALGCF